MGLQELAIKGYTGGKNVRGEGHGVDTYGTGDRKERGQRQWALSLFVCGAQTRCFETKGEQLS